MTAASKHAARPMATRQLVVGAVLAVAGAGMAVTSVGLGLLLTGVGGALFAFGVMIRRTAAAAELINPVLDAVRRGELATADARLDEAEPAYRASHVQRVIASQRALVAWRRGDLAEVERRATAGLALPTGWLTRSAEVTIDVELTSQRAIARAAAGEKSGARSDIEAVRGSLDRTASALARVELAEALVLERGGDRAALRAHLARHHQLMTDGTAPHEREMVRALARLARAKVVSVYREPEAKAKDGETAPAVDAWIAAIAPSVAPYAAAPRGEAAPLPPRPAVSEAERARFQVRAPKVAASKARTTLLLWLILIVLFLAIWTFLTPAASESAEVVAAEEAPSSPFGWTTIAIALGLFAAGSLWFRGILRRNDVLTRNLQAAELEITAGEVGAPTRALLAGLAAGKTKSVAARAELSLANIADQERRFEEVIAHCDRGIALATSDEGAYVGSVDLVLPELAALRAVTLAATGQFEQAQREAAAVGQQFPTYPLLTQVSTLVDLVVSAKTDPPRAAAIAAGIGASMPLRMRHALLADLARAVAGEVGADERDAIAEDLRSERRSAAWVRAVAPELVARFGERRADA